MKDTFVGDNRGGKIYVILKPFIRELLMMLCRAQFMVHRKCEVFWQPDQNLTSCNRNRKIAV